jgi:hypothetical protein
MSGPKVVRVLTKQEIMAICQGRINALRDEVNEWRKCAARHDALTSDEEKKIESRFNSIKDMFTKEQFQGIQKNCEAEIIFLRQDMHRIRQEAIARAEEGRNLRRRIQYSAETLIKSFEASECPIPIELLNIASSAVTVKDDELSAIGVILNRLLMEFTLSAIDNQGMTLLQKELSEKLSEGDQIQTLVEWKINREESTKSNVADCRLDKLLAEIEALDSKEIAQPFIERFALIAKESSSNRRSLLTDSLILDLVAHSNARKERESIISSLREIRSELRRLSSEPAKELEILITRTIDSQDTSNSNILKEKCLKLIKEETQIMAGISRREAILNGLTELGYEVQENMVTAWVKNGRLVVRKPNEKNYGVELGAVADVERIQVQLVTFDQSEEVSNVSRDRDRETIWCDEFSRLKSLLEKSGNTLEIEKALPVGAKPLKRVEEASSNSVRKEQLKALNINQQGKTE